VLEFSWQQTLLRDQMVFAHDLLETDDGWLILSTMHVGQGLMRIMLQKTDIFGNVIWDQTLGNKKNYMGSRMIRSSDGNFVIMGETDNYSEEVGIVLFKVRDDGKKMWEKFYTMKSNTLGRSIVETCNEGFLIAGATQISIEDILYNSGQAQACLLYTDSYGNKLWDKTFQGVRHDFFLDIKVLSDNSYLLTGRSSSYSDGDMDLYLVHLAPFVHDLPFISVYPDEIHFGVLEKNAVSPFQVIYISNEGLGNLNGYVIPDQEWIRTSDNSFIIPTYGFLALMVSIDTKDMNEGNYSGKITFQTNGGMEEVFVHCNVIDNSPVLNVEPKEIDLGILIERNKVPFRLSISNQGRKNLLGQISTKNDWIEIEKTNFFSNRLEVSFKANLAKLKNGKHQGDIFIQSNGGEKTIPVLLECRFPVMLIVLTIGNSSVMVNNDIVLIDPDNTEVVPVIRNGRTLVPLRFLSELFGAHVTWNADEKTILLDCPTKEITVFLTVNHPEATVNHEQIMLDVPPMIIQNRVFVPLRFLAETFGAEIRVETSNPGEALKIILIYER